MDFGSSLDSEYSNPPPPASCTMGTLRSACACPAARVCGRVVGGAWGPLMMGLAGQLGEVLGRWESESHQPMPTCEAPLGPRAAWLPGHWLIVHIYAGLGLNSPLGAKGLGFLHQTSSGPAPSFSNGEQEGADKFVSSLWAHGLWTASQNFMYKYQIPQPLTSVESPFWLLEESGVLF